MRMPSSFRQRRVNPAFLSTKVLTVEHLDLHSFVELMGQHNSQSMAQVERAIASGRLDPRTIVQRHEDVEVELIRTGQLRKRTELKVVNLLGWKGAIGSIDLYEDLKQVCQADEATRLMWYNFWQDDNLPFACTPHVIEYFHSPQSRLVVTQPLPSRESDGDIVWA